MHHVIDFFKIIDLKYLLRSYIIGFVLFYLYSSFIVFGENFEGNRTASIIGAFICTIFFPFSKLTWDAFRDFMLGNNTFFILAIIFLPMKIIVNYFLWWFSIFIGPAFVLFYIYKKMKNKGI